MTGMRVLIVEDEPVIALEIQAIILDRLPHADVVWASSVQQAFGHLSVRISLAFLDVDVIDGKTYPLAMRLRQLSVPFVFVSGADARETPDDFADAGFVAKPFAPSDIVRTIDLAVG